MIYFKTASLYVNYKIQVTVFLCIHMINKGLSKQANNHKIEILAKRKYFTNNAPKTCKGKLIMTESVSAHFQ